MPASARKSSVGNLRRAPQKYIPYRADDFQHGKKTGIAVAYVDHTDEFEPFEKVMSQADQRTPFRPQGARKKRGPKTPVPVPEEQFDDDDGNGEISMELDDDTPVGPGAYFAHTRVNTITSSVQRVGSSSRPVAHNSDVDFDAVPSPRASPTYTARRAAPNGHGRTSVPSRLSQSMVAAEDDDESDVDAGAPKYDYGGYGDDMELDDSPPPPPQNPRTPRSGQSSRRTSFANLDQEASEDERQAVENDMDFGRSPSEKARGKQRASAVYQDRDEEMEPEIAQGLGDIEQEPMNDEQEGSVLEPEETVLEQPRGKKGKKVTNSKRKENEGAARGRPRAKREVLREVTPDDSNAEGLRRSKRRRYSPLAFWRLEKVVYGRRENGPCLVPSIKEIHRIPEIKAEPLGARRRRVGGRKKGRSTATAEPEPQQVLVYDPEEGWDDETDPHCKVLEFGTDGKEVERRVAFTAKMITPKAAAQGAFYFQKIFGDGDYLASGVLYIPPNSTKPTKSTKDNTFVFFVIQGAVKFCVHQTNFILATGGMFMVPRGNVYYIQNICDREARLFFAQARKMPEDYREDTESDYEERSRSKSVGGQRREASRRASSETVNGDAPEPRKQRRGTSAR
ncbi:Mif2/CENP-C like-domain-containing protein [Dichomitus squalens]|uniref:CENP-C homolog n=1 Tax=Dichomitus squalens TaxID=114155 RepID=A0A4Q9QCP7_9APHY|nr:Mif2/CENP-C like-domain-containing protein [Dichomitus squalens]TBU50287.1 Mif2/CENP-C like-domain-containing protein [Dichomitus squalens]TBU65415.1 Mif2/CENP-C like-domain-containing protein [Dichomitus squalens]